MIRPAREWKAELAGTPVPESLVLSEGRGGAPTLRAGQVYLHSRYNPEQEAERLVESAGLDPKRPVVVLGLGLGYHVRTLEERGFEVLVVEPDAAVARLAVEGPMAESATPLGVGDAEAVAATEAFRAFAGRTPQLLVHPPSARLHPACAEALPGLLAKAALAGQHLSIAVVGPLYGGSLPIAGYLANAFRKLGHRVLEVDNRVGHDLYRAVQDSVTGQTPQAQLTQMLTNVLSEWSYARVAEFNPELCLVMAQAPVGASFPLRLAEKGIVTGFWYVENWRHMPYWRDIAPHYDAFFHIQPGEFETQLEAVGCRHHAFVQTGCDPDIHRPVELTPEDRTRYGCDVSFAGAGYRNRLQFFKGLTDYDFRIWGVNWRDRDLAKNVVKGEAFFSTEEYMKIVAGSKVNLNLHSSSHHEGVDPNCDAINPRVFEVAAAGGFQVCDPCAGLAQLYDFDTEMPVYRDLAECRKLLDYYLAHPDEREAMARAARARALKDHTYEQRARQMLDFLFERHGRRILKRGVRVQRTVEEMATRLGEDSELGGWLATLPEGLAFTYEGIEPVLRKGGAGMPYPEQMFTYLCEVRQFAEMLLKERR